MPAKCAAPRATAHLSQEYRTPAWEQRKLGELTESYSGGTPAAGESEFYGGSIPFIRSAEIAAESTELFLTEKGYESSSARMVKPGDVLYALYGATSGEVAVSRQKGAINQAILAILPRDDCDARYITAWLRKQKGYIVTTYLQGGQGNLSGVIVKNLEVFIPSLPEQQKIGFMLSHLDSLITLHQRKYDKLCVLKKSMLDKMFPKGGSLYPEIRFAGFTDPWEQRKLGELFEEHSEKDRDDLPALTIIQGGGTVHRDESNRNLQFDRNSLSNYKVVDTGDFIVHLRSFEGGLEKATCCGLVSPAYHIFRGKNVDSDFYYLYFRSKRFIDADLKPHVYGIRDGRSIDIEGMKTIFIPWTNLAEQRRIGAFFDRLDSLITLHQRKYDKLCVLKKSMLDKMFPKGGSLYPEIRFAGFTDPWEQRKLEDYVVVSTAKNVDGRFNKEDVLSVSGEYGIVNQIAFQGRSFAGSSVLNYGIVNTGDIVYTKSPLNSNPYGIIKVNKGIPGIVSTLYAVYRPQDNVHTNFIQVYFEQHERMNNYMHPLVNKGAKNDMKVTAENALKGVVTFPSREEQVIISEFFDRLDSLITLHQRKLELLRNIKKSMLDKMFV